jgi:hypothetical protein
MGKQSGSGMGKKSGSESRMYKPEHISESSESIFLAKILIFFGAHQGWKKIRTRDGKNLDPG